VDIDYARYKRSSEDQAQTSRLLAGAMTPKFPEYR
jgi:hypothetical protein